MARGTRGSGAKNRKLQIESSVDKTKLLGNGKKTAGKRQLPHPKELSYPVAVSPDESNGSRLLIKCFQYVPSSSVLSKTATSRKNKKDFIDTTGLKQQANEYTMETYTKDNGKKGERIKTFYTNVGMKTFGASDNISRTSHLYYIELPIPQDVNDSNTVTWGDNSMNILQLAGLAVTQGLIKEPGKTFNELRSLVTDGFLDENSGLTPQLRDSLAAAISGKAVSNLGEQIRPNTVLGRATGEILNSNLELLFDSVNLRSFPFAITFSPRNQKEALRVKHIIRALKSSMAAKKKTSKSGQGGIFLKAPDVFHLKYLHNGKEHPFLNSFKHCALTGMTVNYTNTGTFASYSDGTPVGIQVNLTFKELNPIYQEDYDAFDSDSLGVGF
tara:strand:+ start:183 stop:1337 length:1155 start_codon:yes stop_codon:yes gene_type:complete